MCYLLVGMEDDQPLVRLQDVVSNAISATVRSRASTAPCDKAQLPQVSQRLRDADGGRHLCRRVCRVVLVSLTTSARPWSVVGSLLRKAVMWLWREGLGKRGVSVAARRPQNSTKPSSCVSRIEWL